MSDPAYSKLVAYGTILLVLYALSKTGMGYRAIYYSLWLVVLGLLIMNANGLRRMLGPLLETR